MSKTDKLLEKMKEARNSTATQKTEFITFKSGVPDKRLIFVMEGKDDKVVYHHWISKLDYSLEYEVYIAKTKNNALNLFDSLKRDLTSQKDNVYFFVDSDFNYLDGRNDDPAIFVTDCYSIENHLVNTETLEKILALDFHCNGNMADRDAVKLHFQNQYQDFLKITQELNFKLYTLRKLKIQQTSDIPSQITKLAQISITCIQPPNTEIEIESIFEREPTAIEIDSFRDEFDKLIPSENYRGKFAFTFFSNWLLELKKDRDSSNPTLFASNKGCESRISCNFNLDSIASRSNPPEKLRQFMEGIQRLSRHTSDSKCSAF